MELGFTEIMFLLVFFLILFGPDKLPEVARTIGKYYAELNRYRKSLEEEFKKGVLEGEKGVVEEGSESDRSVAPTRRRVRRVKNDGSEVKVDGETS